MKWRPKKKFARKIQSLSLQTANLVCLSFCFYTPSGAKKSTSFRRKIYKICFLNWNKNIYRLPSAMYITSPSSWNNKCQKRTSLIREHLKRPPPTRHCAVSNLGTSFILYFSVPMYNFVVLLLLLSLLTSKADLPSVACLLNLTQIMVLGKT